MLLLIRLERSIKQKQKNYNKKYFSFIILLFRTHYLIAPIITLYLLHLDLILLIQNQMLHLYSFPILRNLNLNLNYCLVNQQIIYL